MKLSEAEAAYHKAISFQPSYPEAHCNLGVVLRDQNKLPEAEAAFRKSISLQPALVEAHNNLGLLLRDQNKLSEAEAAFRKAISLQPALVEAHNNLGVVLQDQNKLPEAEAAYRNTISLQPALAAAHCNLGRVVGQQGRFQEAVTALKKGSALLGEGDPSRQQAQRILLYYQRQVSLDTRLPAILKGIDQPVNAAEQIEFAQMCLLKKLYAASVRFHRAAFAADPNLAQAGVGARYNAARCAALAGCGLGKDADSLDDTERAGLRQQAQDWLRADLSGWSRVLDKADAQAKATLAQRLQQWRSDTDLAGVRDQANLAKLPDAERIAWRKLWDDVAALQRRAAAR
jgi:tetratricopeptide (TPR) repeat protein